MSGYHFKIATEDSEIEQIHDLNYRTFVEEIPQHPPNSERRLVDKFHQENTYLICCQANEVVGMVAIRDQRPFSLDAKSPDLISYLPPFRSLCEIRLLAIKPAHRNGAVFGGLLKAAFNHKLSMGYDLAIMSGTVRQLKLYQRLGFVPFGPLVGPPEAQYQPMYWTWANLHRAVPWLQTLEESSETKKPFEQTVNLMPGPVNLHPDVQAALEAPAESHRSKEFLAEVHNTKNLLSTLTGARSVEIFMGSGTLANDAMVAQLKLLDEQGLVLVNGEFGQRLANQALRAGLITDVMTFSWGEPTDYDYVAQKLASSDYGWLLTTHCETSTGVLNDLTLLQSLCRQTGTKLCLDAISTIGLSPVDLSDVYLASAVSNKGIAAMPGLAMVFYNHTITPQPAHLPSYLDLGYYAACQGVPFTLSSNMVYALKVAVEQIDISMREERIRELSLWCRAKIAELGISILTAEEYCAPSVLSLILPEAVNSYKLGSDLKEQGYFLSYASSYLVERNIIQLCFFSPVRQEQLWPLFLALDKAVNKQ